MTVTPESVQQLISSADYGDRIRAINQLSHLDPAIAFQLLQPAITDANPRVRYSAVCRMAALGTQDLTQSLAVLRDRLHHDSELDVKAAAADALGALKIPEAFDDLHQVYYGTSDWIIQLSIVAVLGEMGDPRCWEILQDALHSSEELLRGSAISALGELGDPRAVESLLPFVTYDDWQVRFRVAQALGRLGGEEAHAALETLAGDTSDIVVQEAKQYLKEG
jgi:HEAT repeat protein